MKRTDKRLKVCTFLLICNLAFIWGNSLLPAEISQAFSDWVKKLLSALFSGGGSGTGQGSGLLRKIAHFTEFAVLGTLFGWCFGMLQKPKYLPFLFGTAAACVDETLQMLAPGRAPRLTDVLIDSFGVLTGLILLYLGHHYCKKKHT